MTIYYTVIETTLCRMLLVGDESGLARIKFIAVGEKIMNHTGGMVEDAEYFKEAAQQIYEYLAGKRQEFTLEINPIGTEFQMAVWDELKRIPYAETRSYRDIATAIGNPKAARAVGMANNRNPLPIIVPCHRVIGANGKLVGYAGGVEIKEALLMLERSK